MAGFIALQMSRMLGMFEAGDKRTIDAPLRLPHVHTTTTWRATPTSLCFIMLVLFCHLLSKKFLILRRAHESKVAVTSRARTHQGLHHPVHLLNILLTSS